VDFAREVRQQGFTELPITCAHGQVAGSLPRDHRDPFDRMLAAQAREEKMALISNEVVFDQFAVERIW
jgi:PIN domain nuclease of toxin-antitoxin system